jgi:hypothetical protein
VFGALLVALGSILGATVTLSAHAGCNDPLGACSAPCPSHACGNDDDCESGFRCVPYGTIPDMICTPSVCDCEAEGGYWLCTADCAPTCVPDSALVPALSDRGAVLLALLALLGGTALILRRRRVARATAPDMHLDGSPDRLRSPVR